MRKNAKCALIIMKLFPVMTPRRRFFTPEQIEAGWRLACLCEVTTDMTVELPPKPKNK